MGARALTLLLVVAALLWSGQCLAPGELMDLGSAGGVQWLIAKATTLPGRVDGTVLTNTTEWETYPFPRPLSQLPSNLTACEHACDVRPYWTPATVPGTVLGALVAAGQEPHPYQSLNNEMIPDLYDVGPEEYTYWFYANFTLSPQDGVRYWLELRYKPLKWLHDSVELQFWLSHWLSHWRPRSRARGGRRGGTHTHAKRTLHTIHAHYAH